MAAHMTGSAPGPPGGQASGRFACGWAARRLEPWFAPFALVNGAAVGLTPILLPVVAARYGLGHVGLVMGAFNLGAFAAPLAGSLADRYHAYRVLATACAAIAALSLWLFPLAGAPVQVLLAFGDGAGFAGAMTIANLLVVERRRRAEWNQRLGWLERELASGSGKPVILAMHHPPFVTGIGHMDRIGLPREDREALAELEKLFEADTSPEAGEVRERDAGTPLTDEG